MFQVEELQVARLCEPLVVGGGATGRVEGWGVKGEGGREQGKYPAAKREKGKAAHDT